MRGSIIGERYARALLSIGIDRDNYEQIGRELDRVAALFQIEEVKQLFKNPKFDTTIRKEVLNELLGEVTVSPPHSVGVGVGGLSDVISNSSELPATPLASTTM